MKIGDYVRTEKGIAKITKIFSEAEEPYFEAKYETDTYLEIYYSTLKFYPLTLTSVDGSCLQQLLL